MMLYVSNYSCTLQNQTTSFLCGTPCLKKHLPETDFQALAIDCGPHSPPLNLLPSPPSLFRTKLDRSEINRETSADAPKRVAVRPPIIIPGYDTHSASNTKHSRKRSSSSLSTSSDCKTHKICYSNSNQTHSSPTKLCRQARYQGTSALSVAPESVERASNAFDCINENCLPQIVTTLAIELHSQILEHISNEEQRKSSAGVASYDVFREDTVDQCSSTTIEIPSVHSMYLFLLRVFSLDTFGIDCSIAILIYLQRVFAKKPYYLTPVNWRPLVMTTIAIAQKVWDDNPLLNADFAIFYPMLTPNKEDFNKKFNRMEARLLMILDFDVLISPEEYEDTYEHLNQIWREFAKKRPAIL